MDSIQEGALGKTFDYGCNMYATNDADDPNFIKDLSKTFDMGVKPVVIPVLDFKRLKQVKAFKDWHGYSQKLEKSVKLLRAKIHSLEDERTDFSHKYNKMRTQNQNLYNLNEKLNNTMKKLNERLREATNWRQRFEMTMPNMGPNYVSFTMMDMHKTINNQKSAVHNFNNDNLDALNHSFNASDNEHPTNYEKEIHQFSQNSSSKDKESSDRKYFYHKKSQSMKKELEKPNKSFTKPDMFDPNESPNFMPNKKF